MPDYHVHGGLAGIYAGVYQPYSDDLWKSKSEVTDEAICAVRNYMVGNCLNEKDGKLQGGYEWTRKDGKKVLLLVKIVDGGTE